MENKEFRFKGLDAKIELKIALFLIIPALIIMLGVLYISNIFFPKFFFLTPLVFAALITVICSMTILKIVTKQIKDKEWIVKINTENKISVKFRDKQYSFILKDIKMIKNLGSIGLRYLTIKTKNNIIKIRVGDTGLAPFSTQKDIDELDAFVQYLKPYIDKHFNRKVLKNIVKPNIIPNFGVYVVKGEKIRYSIINKMKPLQVVLFIFGISILVIVFLMAGFIYYIDNK